jgi:hypothetical protein
MAAIRSGAPDIRSRYDDQSQGTENSMIPAARADLRKIGCATSGVAQRHERGCAACPRREQGKARQGKAILRRLAAVKTR